MTSLSDVENGLCKGAQRIDLACGLTTFPQAIFQYADSLEILNLSYNCLHDLPDHLPALKKLRVLFLSGNCFTSVPEVLSQCPNLSMVGFKSNQITHVSAHALPKSLRWLILTDNQLEALPENIGKHSQLQKLMLAGNRLRVLPESLAACTKLELLRISANQLEHIPSWLLAMPRLSWLAFAGNPCLDQQHQDAVHLKTISWDKITLKQELGAGASGIISQAWWHDELGGQDIAIKVFKGAVTSDGFPADEKAASILAATHPHLVEVVGELKDHPEQKDGLILGLIPSSYHNFADPPSLLSCTRDTYADSVTFSPAQVVRISDAVAGVAAHLHQKHINHGDLYGHNILINDDAHCLLSDFGAASIYTALDADDYAAIERLEVRAFGCLLEDMLSRMGEYDDDARVVLTLHNLKISCLQEDTKQRPLFASIVQQLKEIPTMREAT